MSVLQTAVGAGTRIGRYFNVVSLVPSLVFVTYVGALLRAGAWAEPFAPGDAVDALRSTDAGDVAALATASLALGIVMHPFQFVMIQMLEGYWGSSEYANWLMERRARTHRDRLLDLTDAKEEHDRTLVRLALATLDEDTVTALRADPTRLPGVVASVADSPAGDPMLGVLVRQESATRAAASYPRPRRVRPTRLGNALRSYEDTAGRQYGLRAIPVASHLGLTADPGHVAYQADARQELDLAVRTCVLAAVAAVLTAVLLVDDRGWALLALGPYSIAYLAYRGAVFSAHAYGTAVGTVLDLNRFTLYERLHLPVPDDQAQESAQNAVLLQSLAGQPRQMSYRHDVKHPGTADPAQDTVPPPSCPDQRRC